MTAERPREAAEAVWHRSRHPMSARKPPADSITVSAVEIDSKDCGSAPGLADGFGAPIFEPTWWPDDTGAVTYLLDAVAVPSSIPDWINPPRRDADRRHRWCPTFTPL